MFKSPRILIAAAIYPPDSGGPAIHAEAQYKWYQKQGYPTEVVALSHYMKWPRWVRHFLYAIDLFIKATKANVIYAHDAWGVGFIALIAARLLGHRLILRLGGDRPWENEADKGLTNLSMMEWYEKGLFHKNTYYKLSRFVISRVDMLVVTSNLLKELYVNYYTINTNKIKVISNPIEKLHQDKFEQEQTIIFASRLVAYKNLAFVVKGLKEILLNDANLIFIICGDGPERNYLEYLTRELRLEKNIIFMGNVSNKEVMEKTRKSLFTLGPALTEFNPNYVLQGISLGKPFLISTENGLPFHVPEMMSFDPRNEEDFISKVKNLLTVEGYTEAKKQLGNIQFQMTWDDNLKANEAIIQSLLEGQK